MNYLHHYNTIKNEFYNFTINNKLSFKNENFGYRECNEYCGVKYPNISLFPYTIVSLKEILKCDPHYIFTIEHENERISLISWKPKNDLPRYQDLEISWIDKIKNKVRNKNLNK